MQQLLYISIMMPQLVFKQEGGMYCTVGMRALSQFELKQHEGTDILHFRSIFVEFLDTQGQNISNEANWS